MKFLIRHLNIFAILLCLIVMFYSVSSLYNLFNPTFVEAQDAQIVEVQTRLKEWGYYNGEITGILDSETVDAIKYFQQVNNLTVTGELDYETASAIGVYVGEQESSDLYLMAKCIYAEARGEPYAGMVAVGAVILNRVADPNFPNTIYGVIYQPWAFTSVHDGQINLEPNNDCYQAAQDALNGWDPSYGSLYYYNPATATSSWIYSRTVTVTIGNHVFAI